jgi:hypothetical protein
MSFPIPNVNGCCYSTESAGAGQTDAKFAASDFHGTDDVSNEQEGVQPIDANSSAFKIRKAGQVPAGMLQDPIMMKNERSSLKRKSAFDDGQELPAVGRSQRVAKSVKS